MKKIGEYTARGRTTEPAVAEGQKVILFDGRFDTGYKIVEFKIWSGDYGGSADPDVMGKLTTMQVSNTAADGFMDASSNAEIAWAGASGGAESLLDFESIVDPDNLVVEDLYVYARGATAGVPVNYFIRMEKYEFTDSVGALAMVRNRSQA